MAFWIGGVAISEVGFRKMSGAAITRKGWRAYCHPDLFKSSRTAVYHEHNGNGTFYGSQREIGMGQNPERD